MGNFLINSEWNDLINKKICYTLLFIGIIKKINSEELFIIFMDIGSVADWVSGIGSLGAIVFVMIQMNSDKKRNNFDNVFSKVQILTEELEKNQFPETDRIRTYQEWVTIQNLSLDDANIKDEFNKHLRNLFKEFSTRNPGLGDYLRPLTLVLRVLNNALKKNKITEDDYNFFIEFIKVKTDNKKFEFILWNALFSPYSEELKNNLENTDFFSKKTVMYFLSKFEELEIYESIETEMKADIKKFAREKVYF